MDVRWDMQEEGTTRKNRGRRDGDQRINGDEGRHRRISGRTRGLEGIVTGH